MVNNTKINHYAILGVAANAEEVVIRAAYRALMQRYHPDKAVGSEQAKQSERILAIQEAYQVLSDPVKRAQYDQDLRLAGFGPASGFHDWGVQHGKVDTKLWPSHLALEAQSWDALLGRYPQLRSHYLRLLQTNPSIALEYKTFLIEFVAQEMVARAVERISKDPGKAIDV